MAKRATSSCTLNQEPTSFGFPAVSSYLLENGMANTKFLDQWVNGLENTKEPRAVHDGVCRQDLRPLRGHSEKGCAHDRRSRRCLRPMAMGITQHSMGSDASTAISNLLLITGNYMKTGSGAYPLRGHNNVQGASDHGAMPNFLPATNPSMTLKSIALQSSLERATAFDEGLDNHEMIDAIHQASSRPCICLAKR